MPTKRKVTRKSVTDVATSLRQYLTLKLQSDAIEDRLGALKQTITSAIEGEGYEDDKGNFWLDLDEPVDVDGYGTCKRLKWERRVSQSLNEEKANEILAAKGLLEECQVTIVVLDEEEIAKAHYKGLLSDEDIAAIYPQKVIRALKPQKA